MEGLDGFLDSLAQAWAGIPPLPDLGLPGPPDPPLLIVIATLVSALGIMGLVTGWVEKRLSAMSLGATVLGIALFVWVWETDRDGFGWLSVPEAFVELVARVLR